jgi:hypothetical protein
LKALQVRLTRDFDCAHAFGVLGFHLHVEEYEPTLTEALNEVN